MNILIPMAGEGQRFKDEGYETSKPAILTYDRRDGSQKPMVVLATLDLPDASNPDNQLIFVDRDFHKTDGVETVILESFPWAKFINVEKLTEGQACTCMLAKDMINNDEELLIAGCDNGMDYNHDKFEELKQKNDVIVFTYTNNEAVLKNPNAYGWMIVDENNEVTGTSIKKAISDNPMKDHAVVATFWFRKGSIFVEATEKMIAENDRVNNEFYVDQVIKHTLDLGYKACVFDIDRYICWGTPTDYEIYQKSYEYWKGFMQKEKLI